MLEYRVGFIDILFRFQLDKEISDSGTQPTLLLLVSSIRYILQQIIDFSCIGNFSFPLFVVTEEMKCTYIQLQM